MIRGQMHHDGGLAALILALIIIGSFYLLKGCV